MSVHKLTCLLLPLLFFFVTSLGIHLHGNAGDDGIDNDNGQRMHEDLQQNQEELEREQEFERLQEIEWQQAEFERQQELER